MLQHNLYIFNNAFIEKLKPQTYEEPNNCIFYIVYFEGK